MTGGYTMKEKNIRELAKRMGLITVEDMCQYTIAQLVVKIANKVNELVGEVWRFETDVQEILKTQNENIQYLLGEGLHLEVENIFDGWIQDGTFDTLINQSALKKVNDRIDETNAQLAHIVKPIYEIDVTNPPVVTGLLPYEFDGDIAENTARIQAIFNYISNHQLTYKESGMSIYTGYTFKVTFPTGVYIFDKQIELKGNYLILEGKRAIIRTTHRDKTFYLSDRAGWNLEIYGFTFDRVYDGIWIDYYNLEMGNTTIKKCWFIDVENEAIHIDKQSQIAKISECKFHKCGYVLYHANVDRMIFEDNWVSEKPRWKNKDASIIAKGMRLIMKNNLWVPYPAETGVTESAYINASCTVKVIDNHFGGESGSKAVINVMEDIEKPGTGGNPNLTVIEISNSDVFYTITGYQAIRLFGLPTNLIVKGNLGFSDNTVICKWGDCVNKESLIESVKSYLQIDINLNNGFQIKNGSLDLIPTELKPYLYNYDKYTHVGHSIVSKNDVDGRTIRIDTGIKKNSSVSLKSYLIQIKANPSTGSDMYLSTYIGIISFTCLYTGSKVQTKVHLTPLFDLCGGTGSETTNDVTVTFEESGTSLLETTGAITPNSNIVLNVTWNGGYNSSLAYQIKELFEGSLLF